MHIVIFVIPVIRFVEVAPGRPVWRTVNGSAVCRYTDIDLADIGAVVNKGLNALLCLLERALISVFVTAVICHKLDLIQPVKRLFAHSEAPCGKRGSQNGVRICLLQFIIKSGDELIIAFPVGCRLRIFPVYVNAVEFIFGSKCRDFIRYGFPVIRHICVYAVVSVAPGAVRKRGYNQLDLVLGVRTAGYDLLKCFYFARKLFFSSVAEAHISVFIPVYGTENDNRAVNIIITRVVRNIFITACQDLGRHISVKPLVCGDLKITGVAFRLVVKFYGSYFYGGVGASEFIYGQAYAVSCNRIKAAKALRLYLFALINSYPLVVNKCLKAEILRLISRFFYYSRIESLFAGKLDLNIAVVDICVCIGRGTVRILRGPAFVVVRKQV